jgi:hypothetical protein
MNCADEEHTRCNASAQFAVPTVLTRNSGATVVVLNEAKKYPRVGFRLKFADPVQGECNEMENKSVMVYQLTAADSRIHLEHSCTLRARPGWPRWERCELSDPGSGHTVDRPGSGRNYVPLNFPCSAERA